MYDDSATTFDPSTEPAPAAQARPAPAAKAAPPAEFRMPLAYQGQPVVWRPDPTEEGTVPGFVVKIGRDSLCVMIIVDGSGAPVQLRDGVRHISDPRWSRDAGEGGVWEHTDVEQELFQGFQDVADTVEAQGQLIHGLVQTVREIRHELAELVGRVDALAMAARPMPVSEALRTVAPEAAPTPAPAPAPTPAPEPHGPPAPPKGPKK